MSKKKDDDNTLTMPANLEKEDPHAHEPVKEQKKCKIFLKEKYIDKKEDPPPAKEQNNEEPPGRERDEREDPPTREQSGQEHQTA